ncbi:GTPase Obg/CgtA [Planctomycetes bacterium Pan216]|uniref:GTPase Obg/CgtA n=1 Tax=Kolteria novifilia TaxID=2527975 RepID=A0A518B9U7_9BACT|nr:GTPase Obg/CgtA [Planctomycetes bacterium Pan216]
MPANLTPQYKKAEEKYRRAQTPDEQILCIEEMFRELPKHKGTEKLQAELKTRLKELRTDVESGKKSPKKTPQQKIPRQGAGQIPIIGAPNSGKSRLLAELTSAKPEIADYPFTTREAQPGMMTWEDVRVQLIDTPPLAEHQVDGSLINMVRSANLVALCFDGSSDDAPDQTAEVLKLLRERKIELAGDSGFSEEDFTVARVKTLLVVTHADDPERDVRLEFLDEQVKRDFETVEVELDRPESVEALRERLYRGLDVFRVYTKSPGAKAELKDPFTLPAGGTVKDLAGLIHRDLEEKVKFAKVWGEEVRDGQSVGTDHVLQDRDLVELHT